MGIHRRCRSRLRAPIRAVAIHVVTATMATAGVGAARAENPFEVLRVPVHGRPVAAVLSDLDGDGRTDLLVAVFRGVPPDEQRRLHVHFQREGGDLGVAPDLTLPLPDDAAFWDLAVLAPDAPAEWILLRRDRLTRLSLAGRTPRWRDVPLGTAAPSLAVVPDERGLDRLALAREGLGPGPRFTVPGLGGLVILRPSGAEVARLAVGGRASYFVPPRPGPLLGESEVEIYFDHPRIDVGDVDGDGLADLVASNRHFVRVFRQAAGGGFSPRPQREIALRRLGAEDHVRGSGSVRVAAADLDGDALVDLVVTQAAEGLLDARSETTLHRNRGGTWDLARPDQRFVTEGGFATEQLVDLDSDGRLDLVTVRMPLGVLELAEILLTRSVDVRVAVHRPAPGGLFDPEPHFERKLSVGFRFETLRPRGFVANVAGDWNGDGWRDLLGSGDGEALEVHLGDPEEPFDRRAARQDLDTGGRLRIGDWNGDGLSDWLLYDPRRPDVPIRLGTNRGLLPGTPRPTELRPAED
jgi:hypothetical protein